MIDYDEHYKKLFFVDEKFHVHLINCLQIFYSNDCDFNAVKDYLFTEFKLGLINSYVLGHLFIVFLFTYYFSSDEIKSLISDFKENSGKE